ncbi:MAG TPA: ATP-binding protein, partial [Acidobacteriota bacterium]|nr:ATP-binding protein [Acidobacteriota bacterium]
VDHVLDYSRLDAGKMTVEQVPLNVREFAGDVCELFRAAARARKVNLTCCVDAHVPELVSTDAVKLRQIVANLLSNAVKFTLVGDVSLTVDRVPDTPPDRVRLRLRVSDTGPGIAPVAQARLFQPFVQADASVVRRHGGSGLGLNISRRLAQLLGGDITVESRPGVGSTFTVEIVTHEVLPA